MYSRFSGTYRLYGIFCQSCLALNDVIVFDHDLDVETCIVFKPIWMHASPVMFLYIGHHSVKISEEIKNICFM